MAEKNYRTSKKIVTFTTCFHPGPQADIVLEAFRKHPNVELVPIEELGTARPDIIINSISFNLEHSVEVPFLKRSEAVYVVYTNEPILLWPKICDWLFSFDPTTRLNFQSGYASYVYALLWPNYTEKRGLYSLDSDLKRRDKTKFCHFIYKNSYAVERIIFAKKLMRYKKVDCLGSSLNNGGPRTPPFSGDLRDEMNIAKDYKFGIAFENHLRAHYTTEKIFKCFMAGVVPIYWGNPKVSELINPEAFINCHDYENFDAVVKHVMEVDNDPELYARYLNASPILPESPLRRSGPEFLERRVEQIIDSVGKIRPIATSPTYQLRHRIWRKINHTYACVNIHSGIGHENPLIGYSSVAKRLWRIYKASGRFSMET